MPDVITVGDYVRGITDKYGLTNKNMILGLVCEEIHKYKSDDLVLIKPFLHKKTKYFLSNLIVHKKDFALADHSDYRVKTFLEIVNNYMFDTLEEYNKPISDVFSSDWRHREASYEELTIYKYISSIGCGNSKQQVLSRLKETCGINIYRK